MTQRPQRIHASWQIAGSAGRELSLPYNSPWTILSTTMTWQEALKLREEWRAQGSLPCPHQQTELERTDSGTLTGCYVCLRCGAEVSRFSSRP